MKQDVMLFSKDAVHLYQTMESLTPAEKKLILLRITDLREAIAMSGEWINESRETLGRWGVPESVLDKHFSK